MCGFPGASFSSGNPPFGLRTHIPSAEGQRCPVGLVEGREGTRCGGEDLQVQDGAVCDSDTGETEAVFARSSEGTSS